MGIFADLLANAKSFDGSLQSGPTPLDRRVWNEIRREADKGDPPLPGAAYAGVDEVQELAASGATAGTFDIAVGVGSQLIPVTGLAYNAAPAAIQIAVDLALNGVVSGYTAGDVAVTGAGTADLNPTVFTYSGASVAARQHVQSTVDGTGLTGGGSEAFSTTTDGQSARNVWAVFEVLQLVDFGGTPPTQGGSLPSLTKIIDRATQRFSEPTLRALALEAEVQDNIVGLEDALLDALDLKPVQTGSGNVL